MANGSEKRLIKRAKRRVMVRFGTRTPDKTAFTKNVSLSGAYLGTNNVYRPGTTIQLEFEFPDERFAVWAQVVWARKVPAQLAHVLPCGMGVRFINPGREWERVFRDWKRG